MEIGVESQAGSEYNPDPQQSENQSDFRGISARKSRETRGGQRGALNL
jgi:hypothetical protein